MLGLSSPRGALVYLIPPSLVSGAKYFHVSGSADYIKAVSMAQVKLQLANEEAARIGFSSTAPHTPSAFIMLGLEIEEIQ